MHVEINLDGTGICHADSGIPFLDHMLDVRRLYRSPTRHLTPVLLMTSLPFLRRVQTMRIHLACCTQQRGQGREPFRTFVRCWR